MNIKGNLRKITELGIGLTAVAILALAGCGGGSSGSATCSATGNVSGAEAVNCFFAETGADWRANLVDGITNWAGASSEVARADTFTFVATGANTYTYKSSFLDLATSSSAWSTGTYMPSYYLATAGWQLYDIDSAASYTKNGDGTISATILPWYQAEVTAITRTDLTGQPVACTNPLGNYIVGENIGTASNPIIVTAASCPVAVTYPAGSASYTTTANFTENETYWLWDFPTPSTLTNWDGEALTALPVSGTQFCLNGRVYDPIIGAEDGADNYNVHYNIPTSSSCAAADISTALENQDTWTAFISWKDTGIAAVPEVFNIKTGNGADSYENIYAFHQEKLMVGSYSPASASTITSTDINKAAASAQLRANDLPPLP